MTSAIRLRSHAQQVYTRALHAAYRNGVQLHDPSLWQFRDPEVEEKMMRDADVAHAIGFRRHLIAGKEWQVMPKDEASPRATVATTVATALLKEVKNFAQARLNLARAFFSGARFGRIHGETRVLDIGDGVRRTWWVPTHIEDSDKRMYRKVPSRDEDDQLRVHWERFNLNTGEFEPESEDDAINTIRHVYQDDEATLGYGSALREAIGWWWYAKEHVFQESLAAVERFAQGIVHAKVNGVRDAETGLPNSQLVADWVALLEDLRARHVLVTDSSDEIDVIAPNGEGWQLMKDIREELRSTIHTLVLGANLTTSANSGGSYALAQVQENSTEALIQFDRASLEDTLTDALLGCVWYRNHPNLVELGVDRECPLFTVTQEKVQDPNERADVATKLNQMGINLSLAEVLEQAGFSIPEEGEPIVPGGSMTPPPAMSQGVF